MTDPLADITAKCEQYWNEQLICLVEVHAILRFIHRHTRLATEARDAKDAALERLCHLLRQSTQTYDNAEDARRAHDAIRAAVKEQEGVA